MVINRARKMMTGGRK